MSDALELSDEAIVRTVADDLPVGVWVARAPSGQFVYANKQFAEIMGMAGRTDVAVGEYAAPYGIHGRDGALYPESRMPFVRAIEARAVVTVDDIVIHRSDGGRVNIRAQARPVFDAQGEITHVVIAFIDITREVVAETARIESDSRLFHAQKMDSIGTLAGGVAHDFNNLLGAMKILVGLLRRAEDDRGKRLQLEQLEHITDSAAGLTRALLGFAQRGRNLAQPFRMNELVEGVALLLTRTLGPSFVVVTTLEATRDTVVGDFSQLQQVVMNLALNGRDAMPAGGRLTLRTSDAEVPARDGALPPGPYVVVEVEDTGSGIDPSIRHRIFEPYFTTKAGAGGGTGLGLAMAYGIIASHRGTIRVLDGRDGGTLMRLFLPAAVGVVPPAVVTRTPARGQGGILLIEDDPFVRAMSAEALRGLGYEVLSAVDGVEGVALFREHRAQIEGVVLDMTMPRMDGKATYLALRALDPNVRVLLVTGHALNDEAQRILDLGVRGFLAKPFSVADLADALSSVLTTDVR